MEIGKKRWIFFDFDGTLVDNIDAMLEIYMKFLEKYKKKGTKKEFQKLNGNSMDEIISELKTKHNLQPTLKKLKNEYVNEIKKTYREKVVPFEESSSLLETLKKKEYNLALVTSSKKELVSELLKKFQWEKHFLKIIFGDNIKKGKPDPEIYKKCLKQTRADKKSVLVIEDSYNGKKSAESAELECIKIKIIEKNKLVSKIEKYYDRKNI